MNPNAVLVKGRAVRVKPFVCSHCNDSAGQFWQYDANSYVNHVKNCISMAMWTWDEREYSKKYFEQVRAMSRFRQPGDPRRRRSLFRAWTGWATVRPDGLPIQSLLPSEGPK